ncbi:MAG: hypothetical protein R3325_13905 [Thermoanaerobaculia bacterium]|nr:hypothetical protein [Thermoanaerobaculia bacterium]
MEIDRGLSVQGSLAVCPPGCSCLAVEEAQALFGSASLKSCSDEVCGQGWYKDFFVDKYCYGALTAGECLDTDGGKDYETKGETPGCVDQCSEFSHPPTVLKECWAQVVNGSCRVSIDYHGCDSACDDGRCLPATCDDWIENQGETGVDCGGPCDDPCLCPAGYRCATTAAAEQHFGPGAFTQATPEACDDSDPKAVRYCYKKIQTSDCVDTDGGANVAVKGSAPGCVDRCVSDRDLVECLVSPGIDTCEVRSSKWRCEGVCVDGACQDASCDDGIQNQDEIAVDCSRPSIFADCDSCCGNGVRDFDEEGVDCGGANCIPCEFVGFKGRILYEDSTARGGGKFKPVRFGHLYVRLCSSHPCTNPTHQAFAMTDSRGYFEFMVPRRDFVSAFVRLGHEDDDDPYRANYAVRITKDLDDCHETVWWHTISRRLPAGGMLSLGDLRIGRDVNLDFRGFWQEETDAVTCGGGEDESGTIDGGSAYFNIADAILYARQYADARRGDDDAVSYVDVEWPDAADASHYSSGWEEITLRQNRGFSDGVIIHEYAHYLQDAIGTNDDYWGSSKHSFCTSDKDEEFAWKEGFAEYLGTVVPHRFAALSRPAEPFEEIEAHYCFENEDFDECCDSPGEESEATVAGVLWDLADDPATFSGSLVEAHDTLSNLETAIFQIFDDELDNGDSFAADAPDLCEFIEQGFNCRFDAATRAAFSDIWKHYSVDCENTCDD